MPRDTLIRQINQIRDEILILGSMVEQATLSAIQALKNRDINLAREIFEADQTINEKRFAIENAIIILMATQQPMARDLREMTAMLEVNTELERMGDYAKGIAKVVTRLGEGEVIIPLQEIEKMAEIAVSMLHRALGAFVSENHIQALAIPKEDDQVDELFNQAYRKIVEAMIANPGLIDHTNLMLWVIHNLERMADRVTNICERTVFSATGELFEIDSMDEDDANV
ncbi:MAG: phosphate signaling complex protein PhoU [Bellilinea sp.]|nr:phosphate signaling complex protein PhoU [Bellilinea sp.]HAD07238.1 phosphate transport system regulatory protein PhoU [Anaerolineaceae bacterium]